MIGKLGLVAATCALLFTYGCSEIEKPQSDAEVTDFHTLYTENCSGCHGENGNKGPGRPINDPLFLAVMPKDAIQGIIVNGRPGSAMPAFSKATGGELSDRQIQILVDGIEKNWSKPVDFHGMTPPPYAATGAVGDPLNGRKLFTKDCYMCHGAGAKIGLIADPSYLALASDQYVRATMIVGRQDLGPARYMPNWQTLNLGKPLTDQDITDIVAYLSSKRPAYSSLIQAPLPSPSQEPAKTKGTLELEVR